MPDQRELILFYDGSCTLCIGFARRAMRLDRGRGRVRPVDFRAKPEEPARWNIDASDLERAMHAVDPDGTVSAGPDAVRATMRALGWRTLPALIACPGIGRCVGWCYDLVARHRLRWFARKDTGARHDDLCHDDLCHDGACHTHTPCATPPPTRPPSAHR